MQMDATARDRFGNEITTGDAGIQVIGPLDEDIVRDTFKRTVSGAVTSFEWATFRYGTYTWRFETPDGGLIYQGKTHTFQGWIMSEKSYLLGIPETLQAGETMFGGFKVLDKFGWFYHMPQSIDIRMRHQLYNTTDSPLDDATLLAYTFVIPVRLAGTQHSLAVL